MIKSEESEKPFIVKVKERIDALRLQRDKQLGEINVLTGRIAACEEMLSEIAREAAALHGMKLPQSAPKVSVLKNPPSETQGEVSV